MKFKFTEPITDISNISAANGMSTDIMIFRRKEKNIFSFGRKERALIYFTDGKINISTDDFLIEIPSEKILNIKERVAKCEKMLEGWQEDADSF